MSSSSTSTSAASPWSSTSSSHWGSNGTGPGGSKYGNAGSRFYHGAGRAVTQANINTSQDAIVGQMDEEEVSHKTGTMRVPNPPLRTRSRSFSTVAHEQHERSENFGVLSTVKLHHSKNRNVFAHPALVRHNSTTVSASLDSVSVNSPSAPIKSRSSSRSVSSRTTPGAPPSGQYLQLLQALEDAKAKRDPGIVAAAVRQFRDTATSPAVRDFNMALDALYQTRKAGEPLSLLLETYNDMLARSILPNFRTYLILILALTDRDHEVQKIVSQLTARVKTHSLGGSYGSAPTETVDPDSDAARIDQLHSENNFGSAMALFEAILAIDGNSLIAPGVYLNLLRSCSHHANVEAAIHVYAQLEQRGDIAPSANVYSLMMSTYANAGDVEGAKTIFAEFQVASKEGRIAWTNDADGEQVDSADFNRLAVARKSHLLVWNKMIEAHLRANQPTNAIEILEQMMDSQAGAEFGPSDVPPPASSTYTTILTGFISNGDVASALKWFDNLLIQGVVAPSPFTPMSHPPRPDQVAWITMIDGLASAGMVDDLNRLFKVLVSKASEDGLAIRAVDRMIVYRVNMKHISTVSLDTAKAVEILDFLRTDVLDSSMYEVRRVHLTMELAEQYVQFGEMDTAITMMESLGEAEKARVITMRPDSLQQAQHDSLVNQGARRAVLSLVDTAFESRREAISFNAALRLMHLLDEFGVRPPRVYAPYFLHSYAVAKKNGLPPLSLEDWELLGFAASSLELPARADDAGTAPEIQNYDFKGTMSLLLDMSQSNADARSFNRETFRNMISAVSAQADAAGLAPQFDRLSPAFQAVIGDSRRDLETLSDTLTRQSESGDSMSDVSEFSIPPGEVQIDMYHNRYVDEFFYPGATVDVNTAFERFTTGAQQNKYPTPLTISHLITALGRVNELEKVRYLYTVAQSVLTSSDNQAWQTKSWFLIEDAMVVALAHAGDLDGAHVHRLRLLEQGGAPSADAYGALIQYVKDTTDDTSGAVQLFEESQTRGVTPNIYLYNNIISKLAKARKAEYALELFQRMKNSGLVPSSITYGALIAACARVADHVSAENLFTEMTQQRNFKPRIPPYNTMMQLYTSTKPNRERVLHYYSALLKAGVAPTAHTYKLLIDAYGTIEPLDLDAMQKVFRTLERDPKVSIQGTHWAALINAFGCAKKDLGRAMDIFDSIATHPSTLRSRAALPDAVCYEAMINVLVTHRRTDLMPQYIERLHTSGVHMTAYIANFLIKGYANMGDLVKAREVFESMADPAQGVAAPNNHLPHDGSLPSTIGSLVYREPSTWEVMVRAELGASNRAEAIELLERLRARNFPEAVYNRISGIMLDDSVAPWSTPS